MIRGISFLFAFVTGLLMFGFLAGSSSANAAAAGPSVVTAGVPASKSADAGIIKVRRYGRYRYHHHHGHFFFSPFYFGPNYYYYDRPYYYPHYRHYGRCGYWSHRCAENWGYGNSNFYGCLRYYGCR